MYQPATQDARVFEVRFYNKEVRDLTAENRSHSMFEDRWGETQTQRINAADATEAMALIKRRYPAEQGFVVEDLHES